MLKGNPPKRCKNEKMNEIEARGSSRLSAFQIQFQNVHTTSIALFCFSFVVAMSKYFRKELNFILFELVNCGTEFSSEFTFIHQEY